MDRSSPGSPILGLPHCRQFFAILATREALLGFKLTLNVLPVSALVAFTLRGFSTSLFFRGAVIPWVSFFSRLEPCPSWSMEPCLLGTRLRAEEPSPKPPTPCCKGTRLWDNSPHCLEKFSGNFVEESVPLFMEHFEDEDKTKYTYWKCQVKPISKVVSMQMTPGMGGKSDFCLSHPFLGS